MKFYSQILAATLLATMVLQACAQDATPPTSPQKFNVLFIAVDDLRPELGCYGKDYIKSPNIDALASTGMVFSRAYCQEPLCSPSRTSLMTGVRPDTTRVSDLTTHFRTTIPNIVTLGQQFQRNGYFVQGIGKIYHVGLDDPATWTVPWTNAYGPFYALPEDIALAPKGEGGTYVDPDGKDNQGTAPNSYSIPASGATNQITGSSQAPQTNTNAKPPILRQAPNGPIYECADVPDNTYPDGKVADLAVKALRSISQKSQPFFLAVGFIKPHLPFVAPKKYWDLYDLDKIALAPNPFPQVDAPPYSVLRPNGEVVSFKGVPRSGDFPPELARKLKQGYFACVSYSDAQVGKVLAELDRLGLRKNTIIILWGDHGWKLGEHAAWGKHSDVENDVNAPLIMSMPGMKNANTHTDALVELVDVYPTLCDVAGLPLPDFLEGTSFKPLLDDPTRPWKTAAFSQYGRLASETRGPGPLTGYTMRTDRYRFTIWISQKDHSKVDAIEVYDHQVDPQENYNIAKKPENAELVKQLMQQWQAGWKAAKPPTERPGNNPQPPRHSG